MGKEICQECSKEYEKSDVVGCEFQDMCKTCNFEIEKIGKEIREGAENLKKWLKKTKIRG